MSEKAHMHPIWTRVRRIFNFKPGMSNRIACNDKGGRGTQIIKKGFETRRTSLGTFTHSLQNTVAGKLSSFYRDLRLTSPKKPLHDACYISDP
jgi:hypothetical protein